MNINERFGRDEWTPDPYAPGPQRVEKMSYRGVIFALLASIPFWALVIVVLKWWTVWE